LHLGGTCLMSKLDGPPTVDMNLLENLLTGSATTRVPIFARPLKLSGVASNEAITLGIRPEHVRS
jgi:hypothetical protein